MIDTITRYEDVLLVAPDAARAEACLSAALPEGQMRRVRMASCPTDDTWARDYGFITLMEERGDGSAEPVLLDFRFNAWGGKFPSSKDDSVNRLLYEGGYATGRYEPHPDFVLEGGSVETDGRGTLLTTAQCLLSKGRNEHLTREQLTHHLQALLRSERVIWLENGHLIGDDTDGHIDTLVRFAPADTLIYIGCDDENDAHFEPLGRMQDELRRLRTAEGEPYRLLRMPMPEAIWYDGERLPATYANYLVINDAVICPTYGQPASDQMAMDVLREAYPERDVVGVDAMVIVRQHGSVHCLTMQLY